ncbi:MAG: MFS transporter, partial [Chloroflexota bacterium]|nr:MFS transporter [Chloroflexota bacterium]
MRTENRPKQQPRIFYGWYIVTAHMLFHFYMSVVFVYGMSVFLNPITMQMGWTRAQFSMAAGLQRIEGSIASPVIGFVVDRFGPRKVILTGVLLILVGVILLSQIQSLPLFYGSYLLIALGMSATIGIPFSTPVAKWFRRKRGTAMGLMFVGAT